MSSKNIGRCARCGHEGPLRVPSTLARVGLAGVWTLFLAMMVGAALSGLGIVALGPLSVALAVLMQAPLAEAAFTPPRCTRCGCYAPQGDTLNA